MRTSHARSLLITAAAALLAASPHLAQAQGRGRGGPPSGGAQATLTVGAEVTFSVGDRDRIQAYFASHPSPDAEALPPGIRKNLERGKPLPPGIAKKVAPPELRSEVPLPDGYQIVEVGLDVLLVEAATNVIHDVLTDIIR